MLPTINYNGDVYYEYAKVLQPDKSVKIYYMSDLKRAQLAKNLLDSGYSTLDLMKPNLTMIGRKKGWFWRKKWVYTNPQLTSDSR
jgi:hypothetical protein